MAVLCSFFSSVAVFVASCIVLLGTGTSGAPNVWTLQQLARKTTPEARVSNSPLPSEGEESLDFSCEVCTLVSEVLQFILDTGASEEEVAKYLALPLCTLLKIEDENVCSLVVEEYKVRKPLYYSSDVSATLRVYPNNDRCTVKSPTPNQTTSMLNRHFERGHTLLIRTP